MRLKRETQGAFCVLSANAKSQTRKSMKINVICTVAISSVTPSWRKVLIRLGWCVHQGGLTFRWRDNWMQECRRPQCFMVDWITCCIT